MVFSLTLFSSRTVWFSILFHVSNLIQTFQTDLFESSTQYSLVVYNSCSTYYHVYCHPSCTDVLYQLSSITMIYFILGFKSFSSTLLVPLSNNWSPPSYQSILKILQFLPSLKKCTLLSMCLVCLVYLPLLAINTADLLSNIIRRASYGTISVSLSKNSLINILKCGKSITAVNDAVYSFSSLYWATGPVTCVLWSIGPPW